MSRGTQWLVWDGIGVTGQMRQGQLIGLCLQRGFGVTAIMSTASPQLGREKWQRGRVFGEYLFPQLFDY